MISASEFVFFCERTIDYMAAGLERLDNTTVNAKPGMPGSNSPAQLITHALGACDWWTAHIICGDHVDRDRAGEFRAIASIDDLRGLCDAAKRRLRVLEPALGAATELAYEPTTSRPFAAEWTVGLALLHVYEELAQHLGHLEVTIDIVTNDMRL